MNDYMRWGICSVVGVLVGLAAYKVRGSVTVTLGSFLIVDLVASPVGAFAGIVLGSTPLGDLPLARWWIPGGAASLCAIWSQDLLTNLRGDAR